MKTKTGFIIIGLMVLFFITCRKDKENPTGGNKIELGVNLIDTVSYFFTGIQTEVISLGGNEIIQHGHCWNTESNPTINENHTLLGKLNSKIDFLSTIDTLLPNTVYHIRPYIQTAYAVAYGEEEQIKTLKTGKPVVSTNPVSEITLTSALCGGIVTRDSGLLVTARGVCWDTTTVFRIDSCLGFTVDSLGLGSFSSDVTGLYEGTNYHLAAYATNEKGTGYGEIITFSTVPVTLPEVVTANITNITTSSAQCGGNVTSDGNGTVTIRGVCWDTLSTPTFENNLGHTEDGSGLGEFTSCLTNLHEGKTYYVVAYASNEKGTSYGEVKSFTSTAIITPQVTTANVSNIAAHTAQCGGNVTNNGNGFINLRGVCWNNTSNPSLTNCLGHTEDGSGLGSFTSIITGLEDNATYYVVAYATNENYTGYGDILSFTTFTYPSVTTNPVTNITYTTALSGGNVTNDGGYPVNGRGVCWSTSPEPTISDPHTTNGSGTGGFTSNITGLTSNTTYYVRAYAYNLFGTGYGSNITFTTLSYCPGIPTVTYQGQTYNTLLIGSQCWFKENLNVGTMINASNDQTNNGIIEKYCHQNDPANCLLYGGLYKWDEMMQYTTQQGTQGICPAGWHIPADAEWCLLTQFIDPTVDCNVIDLWSGTDVGTKMKNVTGWNYGGNGINSSGFTVLPGGYHGNTFYNLGNSTAFGSSTHINSTEEWVRELSYYSDQIARTAFPTYIAPSVRCVKD